MLDHEADRPLQIHPHSMAPLATGTYVITNRRHKNAVILSDANDYSSIVGGIEENDPGEMWSVNRLSNGTYKIQNLGHSSFANTEDSAKASQGDGIVGGTRPQQWKIVEMRSKGDYCIFSTKNTDVCWSLPDGEIDSPIFLGYPPNAPQNQWNFTRVEGNHVTGDASAHALQTQPTSAPLHPSLKPALAEETTSSVQLDSTQGELDGEIPMVNDAVKKPLHNDVEGAKQMAEKPQEKERLSGEQHPYEQDSFPGQRGKAMCSDPSFIHSAVLPISKITLLEALFIDLPLSNSPLDYINADANHINNVVQELLTLTQCGELLHTVFAGRMIYRRLIVYIFAHLMLCTSHESLLIGFEETLQQWKTWDNVTVIQNHQAIKDHLCDLFRRGLDVQPNPTLHGEDTFRKLVSLDAIGLCAYLTVTVTDDSIRKEMLTRRGLGAQSLLNLLQARLEFSMDPRHKARHVKTLLRLSRSSGLYPECLALKGIEMEAHPVDRGGYGDVYKGVLHGQVIAVKALRIYQTSDIFRLLKEFSSEAVLWRQLSHPNVLPFYGVYHLDETTPRLCLTAPWMENGNIVKFLKGNPDTYCIHLALDMAQGLDHLHNLAPSIIHGDLKGVNVLITRSGRACLADFGLAMAMDSKSIAATHSSTSRSGGTMRWQAPELVSTGMEEDEGYQHNSKASDIYAFACVCYEMFSGEVPFFENPYDIQVIMGVMRGKRPPRPMHGLSRTRGISDKLWTLVEDCWAQDPTQRSTAGQVVERLRLLPNWQDDQRPLDEFRVNFPPQALYNYPEHPFSALTTADATALVW